MRHAILKSAYDNSDRNVWFTNELDEFIFPKVDEEGYSKVTLWKVMKYFGSYLDMGENIIPFESNIRTFEENIKGIPFQKKGKSYE